MAWIKLPPIQNIKPGNTATLPNIPQGYVYDGIILRLGGGLTKGDIEALRVRLGGVLIWDLFSGGDLDAMNQFYKRTPAAKFLPLWFAQTFVGGDAASLYTGAIDTISHHYSGFQLTAKLAATAPASATIEAWAMVRSEPQPKGVTSITRALLLSEQSVQAAQQYTLDFPRGSKGGAMICAVHMFNQFITQVQMLRQSQELLEEGTDDLVAYIQNEQTRNTQQGLIVYDALVRNDIADAVPTLQADGKPANFQLKVTFSAADNIRMYSELLLSPDAI